MKPSGTGRILFWRGGSLWIGRSGEPTDFHAHHAIQVSLPLDQDEVRFRQPGESWHGYPGAMIAAHQSHAFEARGATVTMLFVEPESRSGLALQQRCRRAGILALDPAPLRDQVISLNAAYQRSASDLELVERASAVIELLAANSPAPPPALDRRIERAVELLRTRVSEPVLLSEVAAAVFLSPDRFRHLFMEQTGMRFRPYVLWLRIEVALVAFVARQSLTDAAQAGGFADSAHFSRTFRRMFGIAPSSFHFE